MRILASVNARSAGVRGYFAARPLADRVPLMHWIADRKRENDSRQRIQLIMMLYGKVLLFGDHRGEPLVARSCRFTKFSREREHNGSERSMLDLTYSRFICSLLAVLVFSHAARGCSFEGA